MFFAKEDCTHNHGDSRVITSDKVLRIRSKFLHGTCAVYVLFLESAGNRWTPARKARVSGLITKGFNLMRSCHHATDPKRTLGNITFTTEEFTFLSNWDPIEGCPNKNDYYLQRNLRHFFQTRGFYGGKLDVATPGWPDADLRQALWEFNNDQRERLGTDWAFVVAVVPTPNHPQAPKPPSPPAPPPVDPRDCGWASEELGLEVISEWPGDIDNVVAHETGHLFGALDEYQGGPPATQKNGLYEVANSNVYPAKGSAGCIMRDRPFTSVCEVSWNQFGLQQNGTGSPIALNDRSFHQRDLNDPMFCYEGGIVWRMSTIRKGGSLTIESSGSSKMNPLYNPHGPDGDAGTIVGDDHLVANIPFSCVVGRWMSLDGKTFSPWFQVGAKSSHIAPYQAYFIWNVNDKKGGFGDNSGRMTVKMTARLRDQMGQPWVAKTTKAGDMYFLEEAESGLTSSEVPPKA